MQKINIIKNNYLEFLDGTKQSEIEYQIQRILNGVPEGQKELIKNTSFPYDGSLDLLNGVDYHKGCYIGQELTYRVHKRGAINKRLVPIQVYKTKESEPSELKVDRQWPSTESVKPGTKMLSINSQENIEGGKRRSIKNIYRNGVHNLGMALVDLNLFQKGELKTVNFVIPKEEKNNSTSSKNQEVLYAKAFLPTYINLEDKKDGKGGNKRKNMKINHKRKMMKKQMKN